MTEAERQQKRQQKQKIVEKLQGMVLSARQEWVLDTDKRLRKYVEEVRANPDRHNLREVQAVLRFLEFCHKYYFSRKHARHFLKFAGSIKTSGAKERTPLRLTAPQVFAACAIYGFRDNDGRRLVRIAYLFVPRKFGKTTLSAVMAVYDMLFGDYNAQAKVAANTYKQAQICFKEIKSILRDIDPQEFKINRELVEFKDQTVRESSVECLSGDAKGQDGWFVSTAIIDEYAAARDKASAGGSDLKNVLMSSMGPRKEPLTIVITTASKVIDGPFARELQGVYRVLDGELDNDRMFALLYEPDVDDREDDPKTWQKVQPHLGVTVQPDYYENEWKNAQLSADLLLEFRTKYLNIFCLNEAEAWFSAEKAKELMDERARIENFPMGSQTAVSFDLSVHEDMTAVSYTTYCGGLFLIHTDYYLPENTLKGHRNEALYRYWAENGWLRLCSGSTIDVKQVRNDIWNYTRKVVVVVIAYDQYKAQDLTNDLRAMGAEEQLRPFSQTYGSFNLPVESFEMLAYQEPSRVLMNDNPINSYCLSNCTIDKDRLDNKKPVKLNQHRKIDGTITALMGIGALYQYVQSINPMTNE